MRRKTPGASCPWSCGFSVRKCTGRLEFPQALIPSSPLIVGAIFRHPHPPAREITGS